MGICCCCLLWFKRDKSQPSKKNDDLKAGIPTRYDVNIKDETLINEEISQSNNIESKSVKNDKSKERLGEDNKIKLDYKGYGSHEDRTSQVYHQGKSDKEPYNIHQSVKPNKQGHVSKTNEERVKSPKSMKNDQEEPKISQVHYLGKTYIEPSIIPYVYEPKKPKHLSKTNEEQVKSPKSVKNDPEKPNSPTQILYFAFKLNPTESGKSQLFDGSYDLSRVKCVQCSQQDKRISAFLCNHNLCEDCVCLSCAEILLNFFTQYSKNSNKIFEFSYTCPVYECGFKISVPTVMVLKKVREWLRDPWFRENYSHFMFFEDSAMDLWVPYLDGLSFNFNS